MIVLTHLRIRNFKSLREVDLTFPPRASILIEGLNEAGKSTLFEAIYFALYGEPLVAEETGTAGRGQYGSAINYHADQATVVLGLEVEGTRLEVERTLHPKRSLARLLVTSPDGAVEEVRNVRPVNQRVLDELGGLDKEALLNSCFVEQKKLAKLEELRSEDRRVALECLLNLEKLQTLRGTFRGTSEDQQALASAEQRLELARIQAAIAPAEHALALTRQRQAAVAMHQALAEQTASLARQAEAQRLRGVLAAEHQALDTVLAQITLLTGVRATLRDLRDQSAALDRTRAQAADQQATLAAWDRREREELPQLAARRTALQMLADNLTRCDELAAMRDAAQQAITADEQELAQIAEHSRAAEQHAAQAADLAQQAAVLDATITADEAAGQAAVRTGEAQAVALKNVQTLLDRGVVFERDLTAARQAVEQTRTQATDFAALQTQIAAAAEELAQQQIAVREAETIATTTRAAADEFTRLVAAQEETEHAHTVAQQAAATARVNREAYEKLTADLTAAAQAELEAATEEETAAATLGAAEQQQTAQQTGTALRRWLGAQRASAAVTQPEARMAAGAAEVAAAERTTTTTTAAVVATRRRLLLPLIGGGLALLVGLGLFAAGQPLLIASALVLIGVAGLAVAGWAATQLGPARQAADAANRALDTARQQMVQLAADHRAAESLGGGTAALAEATADLVRLGVRIPTDEAAAEAQLAALPLATDPALTTDLAPHRDALDIIRQRRSAQTTRATMLREQLAGHPGAADPAPLIEAEATHAAAVVAGQERLTMARVALMEAGILGVVPTPEPSDAELVALVREAMAARQMALATAQRTLDAMTTRHTVLTEQIARHPGAGADTRLAEHNRQVAALIEEQAANQTAVEAQASVCAVAPTAEAVQEARLAVDQALATGRAALAALPAHRKTLDQLHRQQVAAHTAAMGEQAWLTAHPQAITEAALATHRQEAAAAADQYGAQAAQIEEQAAALDLPAQAARVQQALGATIRDHQMLQTILTEQRPQLAQEHAALLARISTDEAQFATVWHRLPPLPAPFAVPVTDHPSATELQTLADAVAAHLAELDEAGVRARLTAVGREDGALAAEEKQAAAAAAGATAELRRLLAAQQVVADLTAESIAAGYPFFAEVTAEDAARYEEEEQEQELQLRNLRRQRDEGTARLGVDAATLEVTACEAAVQAARREIAVKERALQMVDLVRQRMIAKVIPSTTHNLCQLLPLLTAGRYRDCQLTGDYKLQIWDEGAGRYVAKNIFSGGTRDQFSLALRLAFALATLPEELGTTPGFIFLDEPLSSFDGPRTEALVRLLTQGAVADSFHQIFVISHNRMFDRQAFTHHLLLEGGRIADHDLDQPPMLVTNNGLVAAGALPL